MCVSVHVLKSFVIGAYYRNLENRCLPRQRSITSPAEAMKISLHYGTEGSLAGTRALLPGEMRSPWGGGCDSSRGHCFCMISKMPAGFPRIVPSKTQPVGSENSALKITDSLACSSPYVDFRAGKAVCTCTRECVCTR